LRLRGRSIESRDFHADFGPEHRVARFPCGLRAGASSPATANFGENRIDALRQHLETRIDAVEATINALGTSLEGKIDTLRTELTLRIDTVKKELTLEVGGKIETLKWMFGVLVALNVGILIRLLAIH
jgi:uncharacterized protein with GYD domain